MDTHHDIARHRHAPSPQGSVPPVDLEALLVELATHSATRDERLAGKDHNGVLEGAAERPAQQESWGAQVASVSFSDLSTLSHWVIRFLNEKLPEVALALIDGHQLLWQRADFKNLMAEGVACLLVERFQRGEMCFKKAHHMLPEEPAPYANLLEIFLRQKRWKEAHEWLDAALIAHPNYPKFWELFYEISLMEGKPASELASQIEALACEKNSWLGCSMACDAQAEEKEDEGERAEIFRKKADRLAAFYGKGERDVDFLVEYTGALGACGAYDKIPQIIWQLRKKGEAIPWKLDIHLLQSYLALGYEEKGEKLMRQMLLRQDLSRDIKHYLQTLMPQ